MGKGTPTMPPFVQEIAGYQKYWALKNVSPAWKCGHNLGLYVEFRAGYTVDNWEMFSSVFVGYH